MESEVQVKVLTLPPNVPFIRLVPMNNINHLNNEAFIRVKAFVHSKFGNLFIRWELFNTDNGFFS